MLLGAEAVQQHFAHVSDTSVVDRVRAGDTALFEVLMRRYNRRLFRVARAIVGDDDLAEEVVQETYVRAFTKLGQFAGLAAFGTWLTKIAIHEALAQRRARRRSVALDVERPLAGPTAAYDGWHHSPEQQLARRELRQLLEAAIDRLPDDHRLTFVLREIEGLSTAETAECLGCGVSLVKVRLHRARGKLRADIERRCREVREDLFAFAGTRCDRIVTDVLQRLAARREMDTR